MNPTPYDGSRLNKGMTLVKLASMSAMRVRYLHAMALGGLQDGFTFKTMNRLLIKRELDNRARACWLIGGWVQGVHSDDLLRKVFLHTAHRIRCGLTQTTNRGNRHDRADVVQRGVVPDRRFHQLRGLGGADPARRALTANLTCTRRKISPAQTAQTAQSSFSKRGVVRLADFEPAFALDARAHVVADGS